MASPNERFQSRLLETNNGNALTRSQIDEIVQLLKSSNAPAETVSKYELAADSLATPWLVDKLSRTRIVPVESFYERIERAHEQSKHSRNTKLHQTLMAEQGALIPDEACRIFIEEFCETCRSQQTARTSKRNISTVEESSPSAGSGADYSNLPIKKRISRMFNFRSEKKSESDKDEPMAAKNLPPKKRFSLFNFGSSKSSTSNAAQGRQSVPSTFVPK